MTLIRGRIIDQTSCWNTFMVFIHTCCISHCWGDSSFPINESRERKSKNLQHILHGWSLFHSFWWMAKCQTPTVHHISNTMLLLSCTSSHLNLLPLLSSVASIKSEGDLWANVSDLGQSSHLSPWVQPFTFPRKCRHSCTLLRYLGNELLHQSWVQLRNSNMLVFEKLAQTTQI